jgi:hypothetical protein
MDKQTSEKTRPTPSRLVIWRTRILLMSGSVFVTLLLIEIFVRAFFDVLPVEIQREIQAVQRAPWDDTRLIPVLPFTLDANIQAYIAPNFVDYPVRWGDAVFTFTTRGVEWHRAGLRSPEPIWTIDALIIGDSFSFCWVEEADCWGWKLQTDYGWHIINAGQPGTGTGAQLAMMQEIAAPYEPKLIIWQMYSNDSQDDYDLDHRNSVVDERLTPPQPIPPRELVGLQKYSVIALMLNNILNPPPAPPFIDNQKVRVDGRNLLIPSGDYPPADNRLYESVAYGWEQNIRHYQTGHEYAESIGAAVIIVLIPTKEEAYRAKLTDVYDDEYWSQVGDSRVRLLELCESAGWHCVDMLPIFVQAIADGQTVYWGYDFHLDVSGNALVAGAVDAYIRENELLTPR